jgi:hypothetical protein
MQYFISTWPVELIFSILLQHHISKLSKIFLIYFLKCQSFCIIGIFSEGKYLCWPARYFMYLVSSEVCITIFTKLFLEYVVSTNLMFNKIFSGWQPHQIVWQHEHLRGWLHLHPHGTEIWPWTPPILLIYPHWGLTHSWMQANRS